MSEVRFFFKEVLEALVGFGCVVQHLWRSATSDVLLRFKKNIYWQFLAAVREGVGLLRS